MWRDPCPAPPLPRPCHPWTPDGVRPRARRAPIASRRRIAADELPTVPIIISEQLGALATVYRVTQALPGPWVLRSLAWSLGTASVGGNGQGRAALRLTAEPVASAAVFDAAQPWLAQYTPDEEIVALGSTLIPDLWIPVLTTGLRIIARLVEASGTASNTSLVAVVSFLDLPPGTSPPATVPPTGPAPEPPSDSDSLAPGVLRW